MKRQDWMVMIVTFGTGMLVGAYLFMVGFAPQLEKASQTLGIDEESVYDKLTIVGERYGGCDRNAACDSFQVRGDGQYSYLAREVKSGGEPVSGTLPGHLKQSLRQAMTERELSAQSRKVAVGTCNSHIDLSDYRYDITYNGEKYRLDTCGTDFSHEDSALGNAIDKLWIYFRSGE